MAWGAAFNGQNVSAFNGGAVAEEEDERTVASQNDSVSLSFNLVLESLCFCNQTPG